MGRTSPTRFCLSSYPRYSQFITRMPGDREVLTSQAELWPDNNSTDPEVVAQDYNKHAFNYSETVIQDGWQASFDLIISELQKLLPLPSTEGIPNGEQKVILDAGCGDGLLSDKYDFLKHNAMVYGADISPETVAIARKKNKYRQL